MKIPRILIVEDQPATAMLMARQLQTFGFAPLGPANSGERALSLVEQLRPDLVLMDINLADGIDGIGVAEIIRVRFGIRSVLVTAQNIAAVWTRAQAAAPVGFLNKPYMETALHATIKMALHLCEVEAKLQQSQATLAGMVQTTPDGLMATDISGQILMVNDAACRLTGLSRPALLDLTLGQLFAGLNGAKESAALEEKLAARLPQMLHSCIGSGGRHLEIEIYSNGNEPAHDRFICFVRDITERTQREKTLRNLSRAVEQCPVSIVITDPTGAIEYVNPRFEAVTGYTATEVIGHNPRVLKSGFQTREFYQNLWATVTRGHEWHGELHNRRKNGELYWESASISPVRDPAGQISHFIAVKEDITAAKEAQARLVTSAVELEHTNSQLKSAIACAQELAHAAETANRAKTAFLARMSHELRSPLNVINGVSGTMVREFAGTKPAESASLILESGEHLLGIIAEILDFSVLQEDRAKLDVKGFDLLALLSATLRQIAVPARQKSLGLSFWIAPGTPTALESDPRRLQQILINLLQNAVKFTERGGIHLGVSALPVEGGRWRWSFSVADSGFGIDRDHINKIFEPFVQATGDIARTYGGTGLGLTISRSFARLMGGDIVVRSQRGRGSCFRCAIIAHEAESPGRTLAHLGSPVLRGQSIQIVATDIRIRRLLHAVTTAWGMQPKLCQGKNGVKHHAQLNNAASELRVIEYGTNAPAAGALPGVIWIGRGKTTGANQQPAGTLVQQPLDIAELNQVLERAISTPKSAPVLPTNTVAPMPTKIRLADRFPLRVLAADDIRLNREMLRGMMSFFGYEPDFCVNGAEVLLALARQSYDLLLLDVQMPVMDGLTAAREIKRLYPHPAQRPKMVALTANALTGDREICLHAGMDDYLSKPVLPDHLETCILRWFGGAASDQRHPQAASRVSAAEGLPLVDQTYITAAFPGMTGKVLAEVLQQMQEAALADYATAITGLTEACARRDVVAIATVLHALKGCFLTIGWQRIAVRCAGALQAARENRFSEWLTLPGELRELCTVSSTAMTGYLELLACSTSANESNAPAEMSR